MKNGKLMLFRRVIYINLILLSLFTRTAYADRQVNFNNLTIEDGLSQATVEILFQDSRGYIWFGTNDGLNRYNGYKIETFSHKRNNKNSIINNYITDIKEYKEDEIWVGTLGGISKINLKTNEIENYTANKNNGNLSNNTVMKILFTSNKEILACTLDGLNIYDKDSKCFKRILENQLTHESINTIVEDKLGNLWVGTNLGLNKVNLKENSVQQIKFADEKNSIYSLCYDGDEQLLIGTKNVGAYKINIYNNEIIDDLAKYPELANRFVRNIYTDSKGITWFATDNGLMSITDNNINVYENSIYDCNSLIDNQVFSVIEDTSGLLWVGTYCGVSSFDPYNKIEHYKNNPLDENSLNENMIKAIYEDKDGVLWIGTNTKGINLFNREEDTVKVINTESKILSISSNTINDIVGDGNKIFIGTYNGLNIIDKEKNTNKIYSLENGLTSNCIKRLYYDSKGYLWIGTDIGINILDIKNDKVLDTSALTEFGDVFVNNNIGAIYEDSYGDYWVGSLTECGLVKIEVKSNTIISYKNDEYNNKSISSNSIRAIAEDKSGYIWIGTSSGLNKYNPETDEFITYTTDDGLSNNTIYGILIDNEDNIWVSTNNGISKYNQIENKFSTFSKVDGLQSNEFNGVAYFKSAKNEFIFGGINGLNIFNPEEISNKSYLSKVVFDSFQVNGEVYASIDGEKFSSNKNNISIEFFLPNYESLNNIQYYYTFNNNDDEWNLLNENKINLINISSGKYTLKIKARSNNGEFSDVNEVTFTIQPPFWRSKESIILYIILIIIGIFRNKNKVKKMNKLIEYRTYELSEEMQKSNNLLNKVIEAERKKNNYFVNLSHELRTPLNVISSTGQLIKELNKEGISKQKLDYYIDILGKNTGRLLKLINDLIDTSKIENQSYHLNIKENDIVYLVEEIVLTLKDYIEEKGVELIVDPDVEEKIIQCDKEAIERCIINLVSNAMKFTESGGKITVKLLEINEGIKIQVSDTGIGIEEKYFKSIFNRFSQVVDEHSEVKGGSGLGLTITSQIIELHKGKIFVESEVGRGSTFTIILPMNQ